MGAFSVSRHCEPTVFNDGRNGAPHPISHDIPMLGWPRGGSASRPAKQQREDDMAESVYKVIELIGTSKDSWEKAAAAAVNRAGKSLRNLRVAEVVQLDLQLDAKGKVEAYRAKLKVSFKFEG
jgi:flavin-binding protein dodecin